MDRKYFRKLLDKMNEEKEIKIIPIKVGTGEKSKELKFVCMPHISETDPIITTYLEQLKMKMNFSPVEDQKNTPKKYVDESISNSIKELNQMDQNDRGSSKSPKKSPTKKIIFDTKMGRINGVKPKFVRARELHKYLFYLTRDFNGKPGSREDMIKLSKKQGYPITEEIETELQNIDVFQTDLGWKTFIPPLPQVNNST